MAWFCSLPVWKGDWDLPSVDPSCLAALAYCRFSGVPVKLKKIGNPWRSPSGELPIMRHKKVTETKVTEIFSYLRKQNYGCDFNLSNKQSADAIAFSSMLEEKLLPAILHLWWVDNKTYSDFTRPWYAKVLPFPLNFFIPDQIQKKASMRVTLTKGGSNVTDSELEAKIYKEAKECMNYLAYRLGKQDYFFGNAPSSLDALVFGYLAPILKAPLPNNQLQNHLKMCDNLCSLCNNILQRYLPPDPEEVEKKKAEEKSKPQSTTEYSDFPHRRRNMILAAIFALSAMAGYALLSGLIHLQITDSDEDNDLKNPHGYIQNEEDNEEYEDGRED
ncbi:hypothetical protein LOTGIDRAFT_234567 [Lottia gigantea]|uniref:Metaxin n=1 Tax=Lottia gigantea TaxID=225164 RepID=V3ZV28_LOTGI|nr:hypothetical protein LOTGIDRAFT_234567 [Lottia gigantea]ESO88232.1 hypothetical protein LOTGIDRAFT_234567 [Lottia gigantea]